MKLMGTLHSEIWMCSKHTAYSQVSFPLPTFKVWIVSSSVKKIGQLKHWDLETVPPAKFKVAWYYIWIQDGETAAELFAKRFPFLHNTSHARCLSCSPCAPLNPSYVQAALQTLCSHFAFLTHLEAPVIKRPLTSFTIAVSHPLFGGVEGKFIFKKYSYPHATVPEAT